jgi:hypothetical protein
LFNWPYNIIHGFTLRPGASSNACFQKTPPSLINRDGEKLSSDALYPWIVQATMIYINFGVAVRVGTRPSFSRPGNNTI